MGRAEYVINEWKGLLKGNVLYELGAGQEQERDYAYLEVPAGTGQYAWNDYNNNGVQQLNEFELAAFPDQAKFIRIFTPTNEFVKANYNTFNYSVTLNPRAAMNSSRLRSFPKLIPGPTCNHHCRYQRSQLPMGILNLILSSML